MIFERDDVFTTTKEVADASGNAVLDASGRPEREPDVQNSYNLLPVSQHITSAQTSIRPMRHFHGYYQITFLLESKA